MNGQPQDKLSTADVVSAGQTPPPKDATPTAARPEERREHVGTDGRRLEHDPGMQTPGKAPGEGAPSSPAVRREPGHAGAETATERAALLPDKEGVDLRHRWDTIQTAFVDEPRRAVKDADSLVAQTMKRVAEVFAEERASLERQWSEGRDVSTEDLRVSLKRYRSFFTRLLEV